MICDVCGLPALHQGRGDGIGSCDCPRCEWCGGVLWSVIYECHCSDNEGDYDEGLDYDLAPLAPIGRSDTTGGGDGAGVER